MSNPYTHVDYTGANGGDTYKSFRANPTIKPSRKGSKSTKILTPNNNSFQQNPVPVIHQPNYHHNNHNKKNSHSHSNLSNPNNIILNPKQSPNYPNQFNNQQQYNPFQSPLQEEQDSDDSDEDNNINPHLQSNFQSMVNTQPIKNDDSDSNTSEESVSNIKPVYSQQDDLYSQNKNNQHIKRSTLNWNGMVIQYDQEQFATDSNMAKNLQNRYIKHDNNNNNNNYNSNNKAPEKYDNNNKPPPPPGPPPNDIVQRYTSKKINSQKKIFQNSIPENNKQMSITVTKEDKEINVDESDSKEYPKKPQTPSKSAEISETENNIVDIETLEQDRDYRPSIVTGLNHADEMFTVNVDRYGFPTEEQMDEKTHRKLIRKESERLVKWQNMLFPNKKGKMHELSGVNPFDAQINQWKVVQNHKKLKTRIRKGIPQQLRSLVWQNLCGSRERRKLECERYGSKMLYQDLVQKKESPHHDQLWKDINRTFRKQIRFGGVGVNVKTKDNKNDKKKNK